MRFLRKLKEGIEKHSQRYLWASISLFILFFICLALKKYYYFAYNISDLAIFNQTFFNTLHGHWFAQTITLNNYFADHFSPALVLLLPFYAIKPSASTLLVIQVIITALCAWPIFLIAKKYSQNNIFAYGASLLWLINPFVHKQVLYEFHLFHLMVFFFFWAFYFYQQKIIKWFILFFILSLFTREDSVFLFLGLAIFSIVEKRSKKLSLNIFIWSLAYFVLAIFLIRLVSPADSYKFLEYYNWLGGDSFFGIISNWLKNPLAVIAHIFVFKNIIIALYYLLPFLFIPFFAKKYLWLSFFAFCQFIMSNGGLNGVQFQTHYVMALMPGVFLAYIFGLWAIINKNSGHGSQIIYKNKGFFIALFIFTNLFFLLVGSPITKLVGQKYLPDYHRDRQKIIDLIPEDASVCTDSSLLPNFSLRTELYNIDYAYYGKTIFAERDFMLPKVDYILMDMGQFFATKNDSNSHLFWKYGDPLTMPDRWANILSQYTLTYAKDNILLWQDSQKTTEKSLPYIEIIASDNTKNDLLKEWSLEQSADLQILKITYNKLDSNFYLVRFYQDGQYWEMPFDYGLYSLAQNKGGKTISVNYYLNKKVDSFEIYKYKGKNVIGDLINLELSFEREKVFGKVGLVK